MKRISLSSRVHVLQGEELEDHVRENAGFVISERGKAYAASHQRNIGAVYDELFSQPFPS